MPKVYLCAFADMRLCFSALRFYEQAREMQVFDEIFIYNETMLDLDFREKMKDKIYMQNGEISRGFGYWCWKPQIILQTLEQIEDDDILLYVDIGSEFQPEGASRLREIIDLINQNEIMSAVVQDGSYLQRQWTKASVFAHFGVLDNKEITESTHFMSGFIGMKKTKRVIEIMQQWRLVFYEHFELVDDSESPIPNFEGFRENRHDQSIWCILNQLHGVKNFDKNFEITTKGYEPHKYPIVFSRNKLYLDSQTRINMVKLTFVFKILGKLHPVSAVRKASRKLAILLGGGGGN